MSDAQIFVLSLAVLLAMSLGYCARSLEVTNKDGMEWVLIPALLVFLGSIACIGISIAKIVFPLL